MERQFTGTVIRTTGSWYDVRTNAGETVKCRIRGRLRLKGVRSTNPVVVGDRVVCERDEEDAGVICEVVPRRNYIIRRASNLSKKSHIIAANLGRSGKSAVAVASPKVGSQQAVQAVQAQKHASAPVQPAVQAPVVQ